MSFRHCLIVCVLLICISCIDFAKAGRKRMFPLTRFSCISKAPGYYADVDTGCQVYHMCDGMGRQFSYKCPNMTLFQQRMLICDHWYMVNCSMSERDYDANLLIGQRDKPFVSDDEMRLRTPRPDILSVPPYNPYFDVLKDDAKLDEVEDNDLDTKQSQHHYRPNNIHRRKDTSVELAIDNDDHASDEEEIPRTVKPKRHRKPANKKPKISPPAFDLLPPFSPVTESSVSEEDYDVSTTPPEIPVFKFLKRFDPTSEEVHQTAISQSEILDLNAELPEEQVSFEEDRNTRKTKNVDNKTNTLKNEKSFLEGSRFGLISTKSKSAADSVIKSSQKKAGIPEPEKILLPPKTKSEPIPSTTVGPPVYYEWRWAVPAFDLVPPKQSNETDSTKLHQPRQVVFADGKNPFSAVTRPEPITTTPEPSHVEYNISSYFIPDYVFPLDKEHPGYESDDAQTSFQVNIARPGRASYGENPNCPQCHPAYLKPGTCEPCIVER